MCLNAYASFKKMSAFCKSRVPPELNRRMEDVKEDVDAAKVTLVALMSINNRLLIICTQKYGVEFGAEMCRRLLEVGAPGLHFYTLNLELVTLGIAGELGFRKTVAPDEV